MEAQGCMTPGFQQDVSGGQIVLVPSVLRVWLIDPTEEPSSSRLTSVAFLSQDHGILDPPGIGQLGGLTWIES